MIPSSDNDCPGCSTSLATSVENSVGYCPGCSIPVVVFTRGPSAAAAPDPTGNTLVHQTLLDPQFQEEYSDLSFLGAGACGSVYRAHSQSLDTDVAIKFLRNFQDSDYRRRFLREGKILSKLRHENLVRVHGTGVLGEIPYLVSEYVPGGDLRQLLKTRGSLAPERAVSLMCGVLEALYECHSHGLIHRDLKPENILLTENETAKLVDFGLAKSYADPGVTATQVKVLIGTPRYMAPEQLRMEAATIASDIYAAGLILHEMLVGQHPYPSATVEELLRELANRDAAHLSPVPQFPRLDQAVRWALEPIPGRRPLSARDWASALKQSQPTLRTLPVQAAQRPGSLRRMMALLAGLTLGAAGWIWSRERSASPRPTPSPLARSEARAPEFWRAFVPELKHLDPVTIRAWRFLGHWLAGSPRDTPPPHLPGASLRAMNASEEGQARQLVSEAKWAGGHAMLVAGIQMVEKWPADGRSWLTFGSGLEAAAQPQAALAAYEVALARLGDASLETWPYETWGALARALMTVPRHDLAGEWLPRLARHGGLDQSRPWTGLRILEDPQSRQAVNRLCVALQEHPAVGAEATFTHGFVAGETEHAAEIWRAGRKRYPKDIRFSQKLQYFHLAHGDVNEAIYYHKQHRDAPEDELRFQYYVNSDSRKLTPIDKFTERNHGELHSQYLQHLMDIGQDARIPELAHQLLLPERNFGRQRQLLALRLLASGLNAPWLEELVEKRVLFLRNGRGEVNPQLWMDATGVFAVPPRAQALEPHLSRLERSPGAASLARLVRALWYSRQGRLEDSIQALGEGWQPGPDPLNVLWAGYLEILARPLWAQARGLTVKPAVLSWVRAQPPPDTRVLASYWKALLEGKYGQVEQISQTIKEKDPAVDLWVLTDLWAAQMRRDATALRVAQNLARVWSRYWFKGNWILNAQQ